MPRNVVTVTPRLVPPLPSRRREQRRILAEISKCHTPTPHDRGRSLHLDFSKREDALDARARVVGWLDEINPVWSRYVKVYPRAERQAS
jgi:hypothetical protein